MRRELAENAAALAEFQVRFYRILACCPFLWFEQNNVRQELQRREAALTALNQRMEARIQSLAKLDGAERTFGAEVRQVARSAPVPDASLSQPLLAAELSQGLSRMSEVFQSQIKCAASRHLFS